MGRWQTDRSTGFSTTRTEDGEANGKRHFRRAYVDLYFQEEIATWIVVKPEMAHGAVVALQKLADHQDLLMVVDDSPLVQSSLDASRMRYEAGQRRR